MLKKRIKLLTAMIAIVLVLAAVTATDAKYTGKNSMVFDMNLEVYDDGELHGALLKVINPSTLYNGLTIDGETYNLVVETNNVWISYGANKGCLKVTTSANNYINSLDGNICSDPWFYVNLTRNFGAPTDENLEQGLPYTIGEETFYGLNTDHIRYMVVNYYIPSSEVPDRAGYNNEDYKVDDFNHLRIYTSTTVDESFGTYRFVKFSDNFTATQAANGTGGGWVTEIVDLQSINMRGVSQNGTNSANGIANWDGYLHGIRFDIGQVGGVDAWFNNTRKHDCPPGKTLYIKDIMFFNSYHRAARAQINLSKGNNFDPTTDNYSANIGVSDNSTIPVSSQSKFDDYVYIDAMNSTEDTVQDTFD